MLFSFEDSSRQPGLREGIGNCKPGDILLQTLSGCVTWIRCLILNKYFLIWEKSVPHGSVSANDFSAGKKEWVFYLLNLIHIFECLSFSGHWEYSIEHNSQKYLLPGYLHPDGIILGVPVQRN